MGYDSGAPRYVGTDVTPVLLSDVADYRFGVQTAIKRRTPHAPGGVHLHTRAVAAVLHAALLRQGELRNDFFVYPKQRPSGSEVNLAALIPAGPPAASPDSEQATLNVNLVLRWEYRLGSTLFLVYTRAQTPALAVPPGGTGQLELAPIWRGRASDDVLMAKLAYWLG